MAEPSQSAWLGRPVSGRLGAWRDARGLGGLLPGRTGATPALGWQTMLADLALVLFMVTAAAMGAPPARAPHVSTAPRQAPSHPANTDNHGPSAQGEALAIWRDGPQAPPLDQWLAAQAADPRQQLTITLRYRPGGMRAGLARAGALADRAGPLGVHARIVAEPAGEGAPGLLASLAFDQPAQPR